MKSLKITGLILILALAGCGTKERTIATFDVSNNYSKKSVSYQDMGGTVEYIPLETTNDILIARKVEILSVTDKKIVIINETEGDVFVFGRDGKIISHFNHKGQSGQEYFSLEGRCAYDEKSGEFFVIKNNCINVYSETGEFMRALPNPEKIKYEHVISFDDETLLALDEYDIFGTEYRTKPYLFISKQDGSIVSELDLYLPKRRTTYYHVKSETSNQVRRFGTFVYKNWYDGDDFVLSDVSSDTVYQLTRDKKLIPLLARTPSFRNDDPVNKFLTVIFKTDKYMSLSKNTTDFKNVKRNEGDESEWGWYLYSFEDHSITFTDPFNADCPECWHYIMYTKTAKNTIASLLLADRIVDNHEKGKVSGELKKIAEKLDPEDNPVVMIVKFK